jgi:hypothetical protein
MTDENQPWGSPGQWPKPRRVDGGAVALGILLGIGLMIADGVSAGIPGGPIVVGIGSLVLAIWLITQPSPFRKGLGVGILASVAIVILLIGACFAIFAGSGGFE